MHKFRSGYHWSLVPTDRIVKNIPALVQKMVWCRPATSYYLNQWWLAYWRIHAPLALNELTHYPLNTCEEGQHRFAISITCRHWCGTYHCSDVIMSALASQITTVSRVCPTICSGVHQRKYQSSASLTFVRGIHRWPVDSAHKGPVTRKMFPFDDVIMYLESSSWEIRTQLFYIANALFVDMIWRHREKMVLS